ncbi:hypothetical protein [Tissierella praeacuta]|uniref:hypothetical protein n=1 Tax=Tissierella praeacuta TaxID=43131 RepID=UPI0033412098
MKPYYVLRANDFNSNIDNYSTSSQRGVDGLQDNAPHTSFSKKDMQILKGFIKYDLTCETEYKKKGRAYGVDDIFDRFILIEENLFYYDQENEILILSSNKDVFNKFYNDMKDRKNFSVEKIEVNFQEIIKNINALGIQGIWLGEIPDEINVTTLSMFGFNIEDSDKYNQLLKEGAKIKNLSLVYDYRGTQERIMITRDGGVILYKSMEESEALLLVKDVYTNMLSSNS